MSTCCSPQASIEPLLVDKGRFVPKWTGLFPTFHADTPDAERLAQVLSERLLMIGGKCLCLRAKSGKLFGSLLTFK